jgi:hypothetical protein
MNKNLFKGFILLLAVTLLLFVACRKTTDPPASDYSAEITTANDQNNVTKASNQMAEEAEIIASRTGPNAPISIKIDSLFPGALIDSISPGEYLITYDGITKSNSGLIRKGTDSIFISSSWNLANTIIESHYDYTILNIDSSKTLRLQGKDIITNISGGNYYSLVLDSIKSITINHTGATQITFDNGTIRTWQHSIQKVRSITNGIITSTINGTGVHNSDSNIEAWGINRRGENFYGQTTSPLIYSYYATSASNICPTWTDPISGVYVHKGTASGLIVTFGVTVSGAANILPFDTCPYGYKLDWTFNKHQELTLIY